MRLFLNRKGKMHNLSYLAAIASCEPFSPPQSAATTTALPADGTIKTADGSGTLGDVVLMGSSR
jgi:hypothetical protein